jgi:hypothetical protein
VNEAPGLNPTTTKDNFSVVSKFSVFCKFQQNFQIFFNEKFTVKKLQKSRQLAAPKNLVQKLSV